MNTSNPEQLRSLRGFFTKQFSLQGKSLREIERLLGFHEGRLKKGARFYTPLRKPEAANFHFAGYTQVAGHRTHQQYGVNLNNPTTADEKQAYATNKRNVINGWQLYGSDRLIKVEAITPHDRDMNDDAQYPPGAGIQQWKILHPIECRLIAVVTNYEGHFIPDQGYIPVVYK